MLVSINNMILAQDLKTREENGIQNQTYRFDIYIH